MEDFQREPNFGPEDWRARLGGQSAAPQGERGLRGALYFSTLRLHKLDTRASQIACDSAGPRADSARRSSSEAGGNLLVFINFQLFEM